MPVHVITGHAASTDEQAHLSGNRSVCSRAILGIAGLPMAVIGGWLFLGARKAAVTWSHRAVAVCLQGFVVLNATQLVGGGIALAGIVLVFTAIYMALR